MKKIIRLLLPAFLLTQLSVSAQKPISEVDFSAFSKEITQNSYKEGQMKMSVWMPTVYWKVVAHQNASITTEVLDQIVEVIDDYIIVCVVEADMNTETMHFDTTPESVLRKKTTLKTGGKTFKPLFNNELSDEAVKIKDMLEPVFANMLGDLGSGMTILYFKAKDEKGNYIVDPYGTTDFSIDMGGSALTYNLPMSSLLDNKICPSDNAEFPANYNYCPFHGTELQEITTEEVKTSSETNKGK